MKDVERYLGLILRANVSTETFWESYGYDVPDGVVDAYYSATPEEANWEAHEMHVSDPSLRGRALDLIPWTELDSAKPDRLWLDTEEEAQDLAEEANRQIQEMGFVATTKPVFMWFYDHKDYRQGYKNPWMVEVTSWNEDVPAEYVVKRVDWSIGKNKRLV